MKKLSIILLFAVFVSGVALAQQKPRIDFRKTEHNFGTIREEMGAVTTQFEFTNTGKSPVIIKTGVGIVWMHHAKLYPRTGPAG